jgi:DnaJ-domain-containing protein 1
MNVFPRKGFFPLAAPIFVILSASAFADDPASHQHTTSAVTEEAPFLSENDAAMAKMMSAMAVRPTGDVNRDFVEMMIPHHQGAIDMAQTYLRYGSNEQLKRIAQEIIVDQQQEIAAMRLALGDPLPPSDPAPTQVSPQNPVPSGAGMSMMPAMDPNMKMGN